MHGAMGGVVDDGAMHGAMVGSVVDDGAISCGDGGRGHLRRACMVPWWVVWWPGGMMG